MSHKLIPFRKLLLLILIALISNSIAAQVSRPQNNSTPLYSNASRDTIKSGTEIREKLVQLAMQNPAFEISERRVSVANHELKRTKTKFLGNISGTVNYNEFSIKKQSSTVPNFYPRYNIGLNLPLDLFITRGQDVSIARENVGIAEATKKQQFQEVKAIVLTSYEDYLMHKQKLEFQNRVTQDVNLVYLTAEKDFSQGVITQTEYNTAFKLWSDEQSKKAEFQRNLNVAKIELEGLIGMSLEQAIRK
jgi:outer membrane protein TolC